MKLSKIALGCGVLVASMSMLTACHTMQGSTDSTTADMSTPAAMNQQAMQEPAPAPVRHKKHKKHKRHHHKKAATTTTTTTTTTDAPAADQTTSTTDTTTDQTTAPASTSTPSGS